MFPVALSAFVVCTVLFSTGVGLAVLFVGLFILVGCLMVAGWAAQMTRFLLGYAGVSLPPIRYPNHGPGVLGKLRRLGHGQSWRDLLFVLINFALSTVSFSVALGWVVGGLGGITYWFWSSFLPEGNQGVPALLGVPSRLATSPSMRLSGRSWL